MNKESPILITPKYKFTFGVFKDRKAGDVHPIMLYRWFVNNGYPYYELDINLHQAVLAEIEWESKNG